MELFCLPCQGDGAHLAGHIDDMAEAGLFKIVEVVYETLHVRTGRNEYPSPDTVIPVVHGKLEDAPGVRAEQAGKVVVGKLRPCHPGGMKTNREEPVRHEKGFRDKRAGIPDGDTAAFRRLFHQSVLRVFQELLKQFYDLCFLCTQWVPLHADGIYAVRSIFFRISETMLRFGELPGMDVRGAPLKSKSLITSSSQSHP